MNNIGILQKNISNLSDDMSFETDKEEDDIFEEIDVNNMYEIANEEDNGIQAEQPTEVERSRRQINMKRQQRTMWRNSQRTTRKRMKQR